MWSLLKSDLGIVFNYRSCLQEGGSLRSLLMRRNLMQKSLGKVSELLMRPSLMTSDASCSGRAARHPPKTMCMHPFKRSAGRVVPVRTGNTHQARRHSRRTWDDHVGRKRFWGRFQIKTCFLFDSIQYKCPKQAFPSKWEIYIPPDVSKCPWKITNPFFYPQRNPE